MVIQRGFISLMGLRPRTVNIRTRACLQSLVRHKTSTGTGGILPEPYKMRFGVLKVTAVSLPFLYFGATISKEGAAFLEEYDIFVPEDDDDD